MIALTSDLPRKSSRTSTQAVIVPRTALTSVTTTARPNDSFSAATASSPLTTSQKPPAPSPRAAHRSAAIGSTTISVRYAVVKPSERALRPSRPTTDGARPLRR